MEKPSFFSDFLSKNRRFLCGFLTLLPGTALKGVPWAAWRRWPLPGPARLQRRYHRVFPGPAPRLLLVADCNDFKPYRSLLPSPILMVTTWRQQSRHQVGRLGRIVEEKNSHSMGKRQPMIFFLRPCSQRRFASLQGRQESIPPASIFIPVGDGWVTKRKKVLRRYP